MNLQNARVVRNKLRNDGALKSAGCSNNAVSFYPALRGFDCETGSAFKPANILYFYATTNGGCYPFCIVDKILGDLLLGRKPVRIDVRKFHAGKSIMPGRTIGHQRVPSLRAPAFRDTVPLEDDVRHAACGQMLA